MSDTLRITSEGKNVNIDTGNTMFSFLNSTFERINDSDANASYIIRNSEMRIICVLTTTLDTIENIK